MLRSLFFLLIFVFRIMTELKCYHATSGTFSFLNFGPIDTSLLKLACVIPLASAKSEIARTPSLNERK